MAYNRDNYLKHVAHIVEVYNKVKEPDKPDTRIVSKVFPEHNIHISYRTWMNIKNMKSQQFKNQLSMF